MATLRQPPAWKVELFQATHRVLTDVDDACTTLVNLAAHGLDYIGLHKVAKLLTLPQPPQKQN